MLGRGATGAQGRRLAPLLRQLHQAHAFRRICLRDRGGLVRGTVGNDDDFAAEIFVAQKAEQLAQAVIEVCLFVVHRQHDTDGAGEAGAAHRLAAQPCQHRQQQRIADIGVCDTSRAEPEDDFKPVHVLVPEVDNRLSSRADAQSKSAGELFPFGSKPLGV